jgi:ATP-dependent helicase/nuclease subunit B
VLFRSLVAGAREVHLFYSENPRDGRKEKSRFVEKLLWRKQLQEAPGRPAKERVSPDRYERAVKYGVSLKNPVPVPVPKTAGVAEYLSRKNYFSATQLDTYLACGLRFYYRSVLRLRERAEPSGDLEASDVGSLVHEVLREYFAPVSGRPLSADDLSPERLGTVLDNCFRRRYGKTVLGPMRIVEDQVLLQLTRFLEHYQKPLLTRGKLEVLELEMELSARHKGVHFTGRVDRVERRGGMIHILDYKTTRDDRRVRIRPEKLELGDRDTWAGAVGSFQLPVYMLLYSASTKEPLANVIPSYLFLGRASIDESIEVGLAEEGGSLLDVYGLVEELIMRIVGEITDESKPFRPPSDLKDACPGCPYATICGTQWV